MPRAGVKRYCPQYANRLSKPRKRQNVRFVCGVHIIYHIIDRIQNNKKTAIWRFLYFLITKFTNLFGTTTVLMISAPDNLFDTTSRAVAIIVGSSASADIVKSALRLPLIDTTIVMSVLTNFAASNVGHTKKERRWYG